MLDRGRFTTIVLPFRDAVPQDLVRINNRGQLVGGTRQAVFDDQGFVIGAGHRGFLRDQRGRYTTIHVPGAAQTQAFGINNRGQIVGLAQTAPGGGGNNHGFLLASGAKGPFTPIEVPGALGGTIAGAINDRGQIAGVYGRGEPASSPPTTAPPRGRMT